MPSDAFEHTPVLLEEVLEGLEPEPDAVLIDCTFGRGGHAQALLRRLGPEGRVLAIDKDPEALAAGNEMSAHDQRLKVVKASFTELEAAVRGEGWNQRVSGVLFDLGVSSPQLDNPSRGFSFQADGPLDMRMDPTTGIKAAEWLAGVNERELVEVLKKYGEERYARRIARAIVDERKKRSIETTMQLVELVTRASPSREAGKHPATRTFQAMRIYLNRELEELSAGLEAAVTVLRSGGRLAVISFHSLEDRIVKRFIRSQARPATGPFPEALGTPSPTLRPIGKPRRASAEECQQNVRARSAVLRVAERLP